MDSLSLFKYGSARVIYKSWIIWQQWNCAILSDMQGSIQGAPGEGAIHFFVNLTIPIYEYDCLFLTILQSTFTILLTILNKTTINWTKYGIDPYVISFQIFYKKVVKQLNPKTRSQPVWKRKKLQQLNIFRSLDDEELYEDELDEYPHHCDTAPPSFRASSRPSTGSTPAWTPCVQNSNVICMKQS